MASGPLLDKEIYLGIITGKYGPIRERFRYLITPAIGGPYDISTAVQGFTLEFNAERDVMRSGSISVEYSVLSTIIPAPPLSLLKPSDLADAQWIIYWDLYYAGDWYTFPVCNCRADISRVQSLASNNAQSPRQIWTVQLTDWTQNLMVTASVPYFVPAGTNYVEEIDAICTLAGIPLSSAAIPNAGLVTPFDFTWNPGIPYMQIVTDLLEGMNYHKLTVTNDGQLTSGARVALWNLAQPDYHFIQDADRAMVRSSGMIYSEDYVRWYNQVLAQQNPVTKGVASWKVSQSPAMPLDQWITHTEDVPLSYDDTVLQSVADWLIYYSRFHLQQVTVDTMRDLSFIHLNRPYGVAFLHNRTFGNNFNLFGDQLWVEIGYKITSEAGAPMSHTLGTLSDQGSITHVTYVE